eukprot:4950081-Pyramimonas_sp.AAC.1
MDHNLLAYDAGVWGPYDGRRQRAVALTAHHTNAKGEWFPRELLGPATLEDWIASWEFAASGYQAVDAIDKAVAEGYRDFFTALARNYGGAWAICAEADWMLRF